MSARFVPNDVAQRADRAIRLLANALDRERINERGLLAGAYGDAQESLAAARAHRDRHAYAYALRRAESGLLSLGEAL